MKEKMQRCQADVKDRKEANINGDPQALPFD